MLDWMERPHRRKNPLSGEWILVSPHRAARPWLGQLEQPAQEASPPYDPTCYLCPGNERAGGVRNPNYSSTFVFDNDFPALIPDQSCGKLDDRSLLIAKTERGICRVLCFSPRHDLSVPSMDLDMLEPVVLAWTSQTEELEKLPFTGYVQVFENRGSVMGASNPHPHCQIWASESIPNEIVKENASQVHYLHERRSCLLCDYLNLDGAGERLVCENEYFSVVVPFWAVWPFETLVISKPHWAGLVDVDGPGRRGLGEILREVTRRYDALFGVPFPYSMGFHQRPARSPDKIAWHLHAHYYPPLLRSATIRKFMVGYELLASPQRDFTPEMAAARLRNL
jgi:UDPglucose--hexose-1-phosphate uridylyltransferase